MFIHTIRTAYEKELKFIVSDNFEHGSVNKVRKTLIRPIYRLAKFVWVFFYYYEHLFSEKTETSGYFKWNVWKSIAMLSINNSAIYPQAFHTRSFDTANILGSITVARDQLKWLWVQ